jgi:hypothetical protein
VPPDAEPTSVALGWMHVSVRSGPAPAVTGPVENWSVASAVTDVTVTCAQQSLMAWMR